MSEKQLKNSGITTRALVSVAISSAVSLVLMMLDFALPFVPAFVKLDFSDLPALICAFSFGPVAGVLVELVKNLLHLFFTSTVGVGELSNFILGSALVIPAGMIYKRHKTRKTALIGMIVGTVCFACISFFSNYYVMFPFYINVMGLSSETIIKMGTAVSPFLDSEMKIILCSVVPFNLLKGVIVSILTFLLYKRLSPIIKGR